MINGNFKFLIPRSLVSLLLPYSIPFFPISLPFFPFSLLPSPHGEAASRAVLQLLAVSRFWKF